MDAPPNELFTCSYCADQFKREDHLRRHELSHQSPKFKCPQEGCDKAFHRNDVLKRHLLVHRPSVNKSQRAGRKRVASRKSSASQSPPLKNGPSSRKPPAHIEALAEPSSHMQTLSPSRNIAIGPFFGSSEQSDAVAQATVQQQWHFTDPFANTFDPRAIDQPSFSSSTYCLQMCTDRANLTFMARFPFIHSSTMESEELPQELRLALAAIGARDLDGNQGFGTDYFVEAENLLLRPEAPTGLRRLQAEVLLIEFAGWSNNALHRDWCTKRTRQVAHAINTLQGELPQSPQGSWAKWLYAEELKRTIFAFYCITVQLSMLRAVHVPLSARYLRLTFPCPDELWQAPVEEVWAERFAWRPCDMETFPTATHSFLIANPGLNAQELQIRSLFSQHILLCGILESLEGSTRLPVNLEYIDEWMPGSINSSTVRVQFMNALKVWYSLYISPENRPPDDVFWQRGDPARARAETTMLLKLGLDRLIEVDASIETCSVRIAAENAVDLLHQLALAGFHEVVQAGSHLPMSPTALEIAATLARATMTWLQRLHNTYGRNELPAQDAEIIGKLQRATAEAARVVPHIFVSPSQQSAMASGLLDLRARVMDVWSYVLGGASWLERDGPLPRTLRSQSTVSL